MRREAAALQSLTVPPEATAVTVSGIGRDKYSAETSWEFQTETEWEVYRGWARGQLAPNYRYVSTSEAETNFTRQLPGDSHHVRIVRLPGGPPLRIRVVFRSYAN